MEYGCPINVLFKVKFNSEILIKAGYKQVPNHVESKIDADEQWISNATMIKVNFPRFHIYRFGNKWFMHQDPLRHDHSKIVTSRYLIRKEVKRIKSYGYYPSN